MTTAPEPDPRRVAVVTGGAGAIGRSITDALQENGHRTVVIDRVGEVVCNLISSLILARPCRPSSPITHIPRPFSNRKFAYILPLGALNGVLPM